MYNCGVKGEMMDKYKITVKSKDKTAEHIVGKSNLHETLARLGYQISAPCGGEGRCGKCKVVVNGKTVLACKTEINGDMTIEVPIYEGEGLLQGAFESESAQISKSGASLALDIGTTTLAFYFIDNKSGKEVSNHSCLNPQFPFGADVVSRISQSDNYLEMFEVLKNKINETISNFLIEHSKYEKITNMVACGNTTMSHIFAKTTPKSMGVSPFLPVFLERREFKGEIHGINAENIALLPSISAFVGGDITSGVLVSNMQNSTNLLIDIGTNGEIVASKNGELFATATAAGPAFEGGNISCGTGGIQGAISKVEIKNGETIFETIGNKTAVGICGSGLFDCVSQLLKVGILDETGFMEEDFEITENVSVTKKDIREFQVGKSAIASGVKVLLQSAGISESEIANVYIAGGMGFYLDSEAIASVGLLSKTLTEKISIVGNSAGSGAKACILNPDNLQKADEICKIATVVDLGGNSEFNNEFAMNMMLESF